MYIRPLTGSLGAEIIGANIKTDQQFEAIYQAFARRFFKKLDTHSEIAIVLKEKDQK